MVNYVPSKGDLVFIDFNPTLGHEQGGYHSAIVISDNDFNKYTKMIIVCPITKNTKSFPTHYILKDTKKINGAVLCEHIRSIDFEERKVKFIEKASNNDLEQLLVLLNLCL